APADVLQPGARHDGHAVPTAVAMMSRNVAPPGEVVAEDLGELGVAHLGLLETRDVRPALIEPGDETRLPRARGIDVPGGEPDQRSLPAPGRRERRGAPAR